MDALTEFSRNPIVLAGAGVIAALAIVFEIRTALALRHLELKPGEEVPREKLRPLMVWSLVFAAAAFVIALGLS